MEVEEYHGEETCVAVIGGLRISWTVATDWGVPGGGTSEVVVDDKAPGSLLLLLGEPISDLLVSGEVSSEVGFV